MLGAVFLLTLGVLSPSDRDSVPQLEGGETIEFEFESLELEETLEVYKPGVTIRGAEGYSQPTVRCPKGARALRISAARVRVENIIFSGCKDVPGIVTVNPPIGVPVEAIVSVSFFRVQFLGNTVSDNDFARAPLSLWEGVNVTVSNCVFADNVGAVSGGIELRRGIVSIENSSFKNNTGLSSGGAIWCEGDGLNAKTSINISNCYFEGNKVTKDDSGLGPLIDTLGRVLEPVKHIVFAFPRGKGGAVGLLNVTDIFILNSTFRGNVATAGGGVAIVSDIGMDRGSVQLIGCNFDGNKAAFVREHNISIKRDNEILQGGSIFFFLADEKSNIKIEGCMVINSQAVYGGGMHAFSSDRSQMAIFSSIFENNHASEAGGGLLLRKGKAQLFNSTIKGCKAEFGGGLMLTNNAKLTINGPLLSRTKVSSAHSYFIDNTALDGGGIAVMGSGRVFLIGPRFISNTATRNGGGMALLNDNLHVEMINSLFENNQALRGGGVFSAGSGKFFMWTSKKFLAIDQPSTFRNNRAIAGGGLFFYARSLAANYFKVVKTLFAGNEAVALENIESDPRRQEAIFSEQDLSNSCGSGGGGAICMALDKVPDVAILEVDLVDVWIEKNMAVVGGGLYAVMAKDGWYSDCEGTGLSTFQAPCRKFLIKNLNITNNVAEWGGGMFVSNPSSIFVKCSNDALHKKGSTTMPVLDIWKEAKQLNDRCLVVAGNAVKGNESLFGTQVASSGVALELVWPKNLATMKQTSGKPLSFDESNPQLGVQLRIVDAFNQTVSGSVPGSDADVTLLSPSNAIRGHQIYKASKGIVNVNSTDVLGDHVEHRLIFSAGHLGSVDTTFIVRDCFPGEEEGHDFKECRICERGKYSFIPKEQCRDCEANAVCEGGAALIPKPGYWHSTPFSPQFHQCLIPEACNFPGRETILNLFYSNRSVLNPSNEPVDEDTYRQCTPGYKGMLCGSCEDGFGNLQGAECVECRETYFTGFLIFLAAAWSAVLVSFEIFNSMSANKVFIKALGDESDPTTMVQEAGTPTRSQQLPRENFPSYVEAFENLTETVKIFVNYLQVTSLAITINLPWNRLFKIFWGFKEVFAGQSIGSAFIPLDCSFKGKHDIPASVLGIWLRIMFPIMLLAFFLSVCILVWVATRYLQGSRGMPKEGLNTLRSNSIIVTIAVVFFAYNGVTEDLMRTVNCVHIDGEEPNNPNQVFTAKAGGPVWAEDTELVCFQGWHTATGVAGILGLLFFSFGFIVFIIALLAINRNKVKDMQFLSRYGFLYRAYRTEYYTMYWEALVVLRKAFIGAATVYAFPLGPNLQAALASGVLTLALFFHCQFRPYRDIKTKKCGGFMSKWAFMELMGLNELETLSILMSIITFYSGIIFNDSNTSPTGVASMAAFVVVMNGGYFVLMVLMIWGGLHVALDEKIKCFKPAAKARYHTRMLWVKKIALLMKHYTEQIRKKLSGEERIDESISHHRKGVVEMTVIRGQV